MIDPAKQYRTRDGREVRIYAVDGADRSVHGAFARHEDGEFVSWVWARGGTASVPQLDLIEVKPKITRTYWVAHSRDGGVSRVCETRETALILCNEHKPHGIQYYIAITGPHTVEFTEGEGLEP